MISVNLEHFSLKGKEHSNQRFSIVSCDFEKPCILLLSWINLSCNRGRGCRPKNQKNRDAKVALYYTTRLKRPSAIFWTQVLSPLIGVQFWNFVYAKISPSPTNSRLPLLEIPNISRNMDFVNLPILAYDFSIFFFLLLSSSFFQRYLQFTISQLLFVLGSPNLVHSFLMTIPPGVFRFISKFLFFIDFLEFENQLWT